MPEQPTAEIAADAERIVDELLAKHADRVQPTDATEVDIDGRRFLRIDTAPRDLTAEDVAGLTVGIVEQPPDPNRVGDLPESWRPPDGYETERLASDLALVRQQLASYRQQEHDLVAALSERMRSQQEHAGPWRLERNWSAPRKAWQSDELLSMLIRQAVTDEGEIDAGLLLAALRECVPFTASLGWRVGGQPGKRGLRDYGIDPDEFCEKGQGCWRVSVTYDPDGPGA